MRLAAGWFSLALAIFLALVIQEGIPPIKGLHGARLLLVPMLFCYGALAMPLWATCLMAIFAGFLTDLMYLHVVDGYVEIALGWSIVVFVLFGLLASGFQPAFRRGHWWLHVILGAVCTALFLALQYMMISFRRQSFIFNELVVWRILGPAVAAAALAPLVHLIVSQLAQFVPGNPYELPRDYRQER